MDTSPPIASVRFASSRDASALARLRWDARADDERRRESLERFATRFEAWLRAACTGSEWHIVLATEGSKAVGCMYLRKVETVPVPGVAHRAWGYLTHAFVTETRRNRGIGTAMLAQLVDKALALGFHELQVWPSSRSVSLYVRAGFLSPEKQRAAPDPHEPSFALPLSTRPSRRGVPVMSRSIRYSPHRFRS